MSAAEQSAVRRWRARARSAGIVSVLGLMIVVVGIVLAAFSPLPRDPQGGLRIDFPEELTVTAADGQSTVLVRDRLAPPSRQSTGPELAGAAWIDLESHASTELTLPRGEDAVGFGHTRVQPGGPDPIVEYYARDAGVLPEGTDEDGRVTALVSQPHISVTVEEPFVRSITPRGTAVLDSSADEPEVRSGWQVEFDLVALIDAGRTNLTVPLGWYASPVFPALAVLPPWLIAGGAAVVLVSVLYGHWARRRMLAAENLVDPRYVGLV